MANFKEMAYEVAKHIADNSPPESIKKSFIEYYAKEIQETYLYNEIENKYNKILVEKEFSGPFFRK